MSVLVLHGVRGVAEGIARGLEQAGCEAVIDRDVDLGSMRAVRQAVSLRRPRAVILARAWDDREACEVQPERAFTENAEWVIHVGAACLEFCATPILLSVADVFGKSGGPFCESDEPTPVSAWARSRLQGEKFLLRVATRALVVRTGPIIPDGLEEVKEQLLRGPVEEADDELVSPIGAFDLGLVIHALLEGGAFGVFHAATADAPVSRFDFWRALSVAVGEGAGDERRVIGRPGRALMTQEEHAQRARSPALVPDKIARYLRAPLTPWRQGIRRAMEATMGERQGVRRVEKPWGHEIIWAHTDRYVGKILFVKSGERLSLQYHERKDETVYVLSGKMVFEVGPKDGPREDLIMKPGDAYRITPSTTHRMIALEDTQILEASTPELDDVVRLEDHYGREGTNRP